MTGNVILWPRPGVFFANSKFFDGLTQDQQATLRTAAASAYAASVESVSANAPGAVERLRGRGLAMVEASETALADLRAAVEPVYAEIGKDQGTKETIDAIKTLRDASDAAPEAVECAVAVASPSSAAAPSAGPTAIDGTWQVSFTEAELAAPPLLYDEGELNADNWGDFTLTFDGKGRVELTQANAIDQSWTSRTYTVTGDRVVLAYDKGINLGETFSARWSLFRDTLTFEGVPGDELPTPYLVKSWTKVP